MEHNHVYVELKISRKFTFKWKVNTGSRGCVFQVDCVFQSLSCINGHQRREPIKDKIRIRVKDEMHS